MSVLMEANSQFRLIWHFCCFELNKNDQKCANLCTTCLLQYKCSRQVVFFIEEEEAADDIITMITAWSIGQLSDEGAKKMNKDDLRKVAKETIDITAKKKYKTAGGKTVELPDVDYAAVEVFSPERLQKIRMSLLLVAQAQERRAFTPNPI